MGDHLPALDDQRVAWELREAWLARRQVRLTLSERCVIRTVVGTVKAVAVTGAFATVDGWHVPVTEVQGVGKPTIGDIDAYAHEMHRLREEAGHVIGS